MPRFTVIEGTPAPDTPKERVRARLRKTAVSQVIQCHRCGGREVMTLTSGMLFKEGKATGGTKQIACASCYLKGERVILL